MLKKFFRTSTLFGLNLKAKQQSKKSGLGQPMGSLLSRASESTRGQGGTKAESVGIGRYGSAGPI